MSLVLLAGCSGIERVEPVERKTFGERLVDLIFYNLNGGKTDEEIAENSIRAEQLARGSEAAFLNAQDNAKK